MKVHCFSRLSFALVAAVTLFAGCTTTPGDVMIEDMSPGELPASVIAAIAAERGDFTALEVQKKVRSGRIYYDVEGQTADGAEIEFDVLMRGKVAQIVEIQRDLDFDDVPEEVAALALEAGNGAVPVRIIESVQTDGAVIYEFFAQGQPDDPSHEVRVKGAKAELLTTRWKH